MLDLQNMTLSEATPLAPDRQELRQILRDCYSLTKPNITFEILVTTFTGMWLASGGPPDWLLAFWTLVGVGLASGSSCAFNNYIDREIDKHMERTRNRPLPAGRLSPQVALVLGSLFGVLSFLVLFLRVEVEILLASLLDDCLERLFKVSW